MKTIITGIAVLFFATSLLPFATMPAAGGSPQAQVRSCTEDAGKQDLQGEQREKFISDCLASKPVETEKKLTAQQEKMRECNREAREKSLKGEDRRKFMSGCLKG